MFDVVQQVLDDGSIEVGVHIADVSFFVRPGTALDREASLRSNTVCAAPPSMQHPLCVIF